MRRIRPEKRRHPRRHLHRIVNTQPLQSLQVENSIVEITVRAFLTVNTLPLTKHLPLHDVYHPALRRAEKDQLLNVGDD